MAATASAASGAVPTVVTFSVNGHTQKVLQRLAEDDRTGSDVTATTSLADYLRLHRGLSGTKIMCREGMCGACVVNVTSQNPATGQMESRAVNSCMAPVRACQDWQVETVEGVGNRRDGYHPVQARLAHMNGTQCGYCSPGMVMSMYSLLKSGEEVTPERVEQTMDGNICRCTGYRPILDAFKTFAADTDEKTRQLVRDIEETAGCRGGSGGACRPSAACAGCPRAAVALTAAEDDWRLPESLPQALRDAAALSAGGRRVRLRGRQHLRWCSGQI
ncbi:xanthine dehydrogenase/oxidase-like [Pollicipes pollicipes]|uniref:xanthine dehydrogenase/oxidase-like n=1 Tax=Pollicipes pollicipes TaxID=41117 RepID=UPI001884A17E|nr:xanthine dehydrogenase/oxidase-like [Pollicipes pollicipes]